jgi:hypothetical protein
VGHAFPPTQPLTGPPPPLPLELPAWPPVPPGCPPLALPAIPTFAAPPPPVAPAWPVLAPAVELPAMPLVAPPVVPPVELPVVPPDGLPVAPPFEPPDVPPLGLPVAPPCLPLPPAPEGPLPSEAHAGIKKARQIPEIERCARLMVNMSSIARRSAELSYGLTKSDRAGSQPPCGVGDAPGPAQRTSAGPGGLRLRALGGRPPLVTDQAK